MLPKAFLNTDSPCWPWPGTFHGKGYGKAQVDGVQQAAHRYVYEHLVGPIPDGFVLDHLCLNKGCVNPAHLEPVTIAENTRRGTGTLLHCKWGHEWNELNTHINNKGWRICRLCRNRRKRDHIRRNRAAVAHRGGQGTNRDNRDR